MCLLVLSLNSIKKKIKCKIFKLIKLNFLNITNMHKKYIKRKK